MAFIAVDVTLENKGYRILKRGIIDTGYKGVIFLDDDLAKPLGIDLTREGRPAQFYGVGGQMKLGWSVPLDRISIETIPGCALEKIPAATVGALDIPDAQVLLGHGFIRSTGMVIDFSKPELRISCRGGSPAVVAEEEAELFPMHLIYGAGIALGAILVLMFLTD